jgi:hypothetical protein
LRTTDALFALFGPLFCSHVMLRNPKFCAAVRIPHVNRLTWYSTMSYSTPDLVLSDVNVERFYDRNDLHIYINDKLFFGEGIHPSSHITAYHATLRLSNRSQCHLGESVRLYGYRCCSLHRLQRPPSTETTFL